jgi:membrane protein
MTNPPIHTKNVVEVFSESISTSLEHKVPRMGAALAYYTAFSLAPLLTLLFSLLCLFMKQDEASKRIVAEMSNTVGAEGNSAVEMILSHSGTTSEISFGTLFSVLILIATASGTFVELQDSLNTIYGVPKQEFPWLAMLKDRILSVAMIFVVGFFLVVSIIASAFLNALTHKLNLPVEGGLLDVANEFVLFTIVAGLFATIYKMLPNMYISWQTVAPGAALGALLFVVGKSLLTWYISRGSFSSQYGAAASFMAILFWVFYSAQILYFGAEFTSAWSRRFGAPVSAGELPKHLDPAIYRARTS